MWFVLPQSKFAVSIFDFTNELSPLLMLNLSDVDFHRIIVMLTIKEYLPHQAAPDVKVELVSAEQREAA